MERVVGEEADLATAHNGRTVPEQDARVDAHVRNGRHDRPIRGVRDDPCGGCQRMLQALGAIVEYRLVPRRDVQTGLVRDPSVRGRHREWFEDPLGDEVGHRRPRDVLQDRAHQLVAVVRVPEPLARWERRRQRARDRDRPGARRRLLGPDRQAARVREQVPERDRAERLGKLQPRQQVVHANVELEPTGLHLLQHADRSERLRDRADLEPGLRPDRCLRRHVGEAAHHDTQGPLPVGDGQRESRRVRERKVVLDGLADPLEGVPQPGHGLSRRRRA